MSKTYSNLYTQVVKEIEKRMQTTSSVGSTVTTSASSVSSITSAELAEIVTTISTDLAELIEPRIISGLDVTAGTPYPTSWITVTAGTATSGGSLWELTTDQALQIPFDSTNYIFYVIIEDNALSITTTHNNSQCEICKIVVPKPGTTSAVVDDKPSDGYDAYIISAKDIVYGEDREFDDTSIEKLRDVIGPVLADNLIGNIRLSENLKITNTQGSLELDSSSVNIISTAGTIVAKFNRNGTFFYDDDGKEIAKFATDEARVGNIKIFQHSIQSGNFVSGNLGSGFQILDSGDAEFNNILIRGSLASVSFEKDTVSAIGGNLLVMDSDILDEDMTALDSSVLKIKGDTTFAVGDILRIQDGYNAEWFQVVSRDVNTYTVVRDKSGIHGVDNNPAWKAGTTVVNYGSSGDGGVYMTSSEANSPYISVLSHAGVPWSSITTHLRLGNLNGFLDYLTDLYGIGIGSTDAYLKYDSTNGLRVAGHTLLGSLNVSTSGYIASGQTAYNTGSGYWLEYNNGTPRVSLGTSGGQGITWDGSNLVINGSITVTGGNASVTFYQATEPLSGMKNGDYWIDTDDNNKLYIYQSSTWVEITSGGGITTFRQSSIPTAVTAGDLWIDTDDSKLYRATNAGDDQIIAGEWELQNAAIATGWSHASDTTLIDGGDIYTGTITSNSISTGAITAEKIDVETLSAITADLGTITAGSVTGATLQTSGAGSRVIMNATNLKAYDTYGDEMLNAEMTGINSGDVTIGNYTSGAGIKWDRSAYQLNVKGGITATSGDFTGTVNIGTAGKVFIDGANEVIKVYDADSNLRVELGKLS